MSLNLGVMSAAVTLDDADYRKKLSGLESASESTFKRVATLAIGYLSLRGISSFAKNAVLEFSRLEEANNKFVNVFRNIPAASREVADELAKTFNLSEQSTKEMLSGTGDLLTGFGFAEKNALALSKAAATLGVDLASYQNYAGGAKGATEALTKGMLGETECLKALGVVIKKDSDEYKTLVAAFQSGGLSDSDFVKVFGTEGSEEYTKAIEQFREAQNLTEQQAAATAVLALAHRQSMNAIGDYNRPGETFAQTQMQMVQSTEKALASIGAFLVEGVHPAIKDVNSLIGKFNEFDGSTQNLIIRTTGLAAAFALISKTGMLTAANKSLGAMSGVVTGGGLSGIKEKAEADVVITTENLKRTEYAKTDAYREAHAAAQSIRIARLAVQEQEAAVNSAKAQLASARASGDATQILTAKKQLAVATQNLTKAQLAESAATQQLAAKHTIARTATMQHSTASKACAIANKTNTAAATLAGRAQVVLATGMHTAKTAAYSLYAALGPLGVAMIALSGAYLAINYMTEKRANALAGEAAAAHEATQKAEELAAAHEKEREADNSAIDRLQELSKYERLNNSEKSEAESIIDRLTKKYGDLDISIDSTTGKLRIGANAWKQMSDEQAKVYQNDLSERLNANLAEYQAELENTRGKLGSTYKDIRRAIDGFLGVSGPLVGNAENYYSSDSQLELDTLQKSKTLEEQIAAYDALRLKYKKEGRDADSEALKKVLEILQARKKLSDEEREFQKSRQIPKTEQEQQKRERSEAERNAGLALESAEWNLKFNSSGAEGQVNMLGLKLDELLQKQSGKYKDLDAFKAADRSSMTEQELKDLRQIVDLEDQRARLREQSAKAFDAERESYEKYLQRREDQQRDKSVERELQQAQKSGDKAGTDAIMQREYAKARDAAKNMQRQYEKAVFDAEADGIRTEEEDKRIQKLRSQMQDAMSDEDKWRNRIEDSDMQNDNKHQKMVGAWSAELLAASLGDNSPQVETAKNTKENVRLTRQLVEQGQDESEELSYT